MGFGKIEKNQKILFLILPIFPGIDTKRGCGFPLFRAEAPGDGFLLTGQQQRLVDKLRRSTTKRHTHLAHECFVPCKFSNSSKKQCNSHTHFFIRQTI